MPYKTKEQQREYQKNWYEKRRQEFFRDKSCLHCNTTEKLELHHRHPKEKESHNIWSWSNKRRETEIAKCVVLCHTCHKRIHGQYIREELLQMIRSYQKTTGKVPAYHTSKMSVNPKAFVREFGSWNNAIRAAGLEPRETTREY